MFLFYSLLATSFRCTVQVQMDERDRFGANMQGLYVKIKGAFSSRCCFEESPFISFSFFCKWGVLFTTAVLELMGFRRFGSL
jgi:hypothetical protein